MAFRLSSWPPAGSGHDVRWEYSYLLIMAGRLAWAGTRSGPANPILTFALLA